MRHWWVNQNQMFRHELAGGYLWSPKRNANGARGSESIVNRSLSPFDCRRYSAGSACGSGNHSGRRAVNIDKPIPLGKLTDRLGYTTPLVTRPFMTTAHFLVATR